MDRLRWADVLRQVAPKAAPHFAAALRAIAARHDPPPVDAEAVHDWIGPAEREPVLHRMDTHIAIGRLR